MYRDVKLGWSICDRSMLNSMDNAKGYIVKSNQPYAEFNSDGNFPVGSVTICNNNTVGIFEYFCPMILVLYSTRLGDKPSNEPVKVTIETGEEVVPLAASKNPYDIPELPRWFLSDIISLTNQHQTIGKIELPFKMELTPGNVVNHIVIETRNRICPKYFTTNEINAALKYARLKEVPDYDERYYNTQACNIYDAFLAGVELNR